ncbi:hypothetical protein ES703_117579 [subsurface metagenome]
MAVINIASVQSGSKSYTVHVVLTEGEVVGDQSEVVVLGEAFLEIPEGTEMADVKDLIIKAAQGIMKKHQDSLDKRKDIEELDFPPIE